MLIRELEKHWKELGNVPTDEDSCIDEPFILETSEGITTFNKGEDVENIWHWFEEQNENFMVAVALGVAEEKHIKQYNEAKEKENLKAGDLWTNTKFRQY